MAMVKGWLTLFPTHPSSDKHSVWMGKIDNSEQVNRIRQKRRKTKVQKQKTHIWVSMNVASYRSWRRWSKCRSKARNKIKKGVQLMPQAMRGDKWLKDERRIFESKTLLNLKKGKHNFGRKFFRQPSQATHHHVPPPQPRNAGVQKVERYEDRSLLDPARKKTRSSRCERKKILVWHQEHWSKGCALRWRWISSSV